MVNEQRPSEEADSRGEDARGKDVWDKDSRQKNVGEKHSRGTLDYDSSRRVVVLLVGSTLLLAIAIVWIGATWWGEHRADQRWADSLDELRVQIVGHDYRLYMRYPGRDQELMTSDDRFGTRDLHVPAGASVRMGLTSLDYVYLIEIPALEVYEIAAPDLEFEVTFQAPHSGVYELLGSEMCGYDHSSLLGKLRVQKGGDFVRTMSDLSREPIDQKGTPEVP